MEPIDTAVFESLPYIGALTDGSGNIISVNQAWKEFGRQNGLDSEYEVVGENYLEIAREANGPYADSVVEKLSDLLQGKLDDFRLQYPCHGPEEPRWFRLYAKRFESTAEQAVLILHENVTEERVSKAIGDSIWEPLLTHLQHRSEERHAKTASDDRDATHDDQPVEPELLEKGIGSILRARYNTSGAVEGIYSYRNESSYPDWEVQIDRLAKQSNST